jgi:hypothetical protein
MNPVPLTSNKSNAYLSYKISSLETPGRWYSCALKVLVFALPAGVYFLILESKDIIKWKMLIKKLILHSFTDLFSYKELNLNS